MKDKKVILGLVLLLFVAVDLFFVFGLQIANFAKVDKKNRDIKTKIVSYDKDVMRKSSYQKQKEDLETEVILVESRFLGKKDVPYILSEINKTAKKQIIEVKNIRQEEIIETGSSYGVKFYDLPVTVSLNVGYHDFARFINSLEKKESPIKLKSIVIKGQSPTTHVDAVLAGVAKASAE